VAFDKSNPSTSLFAAGPASGLAGTVLVRLVKCWPAHARAVDRWRPNGAAVSGFGLIAEDGNPLPGVTRVQNEVFMAPGKTYDVMINVPANCPGLRSPFAGATSGTRVRAPIMLMLASASRRRDCQPAVHFGDGRVASPDTGRVH